MNDVSESFEELEAALDDLRNGRMIIAVDDERRENEGDLIMAADLVTPDAVNFMVTHGRGLVCVALPPGRCDELDLPPMASRNQSRNQTAFTVSVEAKDGTTTGISAADRARTIEVLADPAARPGDLVRPGHVFPLRAARGGVLHRAGHTEAAVDLARLAGRRPAGVLCEVMSGDGTMARRPELEEFAARHGLRILGIDALIRYRMARERLVHRVASPELPTSEGDWRLHAYRTDVDDKVPLALVLGEISEDDEVLVRVHSECLTGDVFGSVRCDCGAQLQAAKEAIAAAGCGVIVYLRQEGRGIGLLEKLRAYELQDDGLDTVEANRRLGHLPDKRDYGIGAQILRDIGVRRIRYLTNNPHKFVGLRGYGLEIVERVPIEAAPHERSRAYLKAKKEKLGHILRDV